MKKLMIAILSLSMCFCLMTINSNDIKAEQTPVVCGGLKYDGDTSGGKTGWLEHNGSSYVSIDATRLDQLGISMSDNTATFSKSLSSSTERTVVINSELNIVLANDITISNSNASRITIGLFDDVLIDGQNHTLTVTSDGAASIYSNYLLKLKDVFLVSNSITSNSNTYNIFIATGDLKLYGNTTIESSVNFTGGVTAGESAIAFSNVSSINIEFSPDATTKTIAGNSTGNKADPTTTIHDEGITTPYVHRAYYLDGTTTFATYIKIVNDTTPLVDNTPPTTCEYVIGPRWHWNDDLGVCELEGYEVINTSTK